MEYTMENTMQQPSLGQSGHSVGRSWLRMHAGTRGIAVLSCILIPSPTPIHKNMTPHTGAAMFLVGSADTRHTCDADIMARRICY